MMGVHENYFFFFFFLVDGILFFHLGSVNDNNILLCVFNLEYFSSVGVDVCVCVCQCKHAWAITKK